MVRKFPVMSAVLMHLSPHGGSFERGLCFFEIVLAAGLVYEWKVNRGLLDFGMAQFAANTRLNVKPET